MMKKSSENPTIIVLDENKKSKILDKKTSLSSKNSPIENVSQEFYETEQDLKPILDAVYRLSPQAEFRWHNHEWIRHLTKTLDEKISLLHRELDGMILFKDAFCDLSRETIALFKWIDNEKPFRDMTQHSFEYVFELNQFKESLKNKVKENFYEELSILNVDVLINFFPEEIKKGIDLLTLFHRAQLTKLVKYFSSEEIFVFFHRFSELMTLLNTCHNESNAISKERVPQKNQTKEMINVLMEFYAEVTHRKSLRNYLVNYFIGKISEQVPAVDSAEQSKLHIKRKNIMDITRNFADAIRDKQLSDIQEREFAIWKTNVLDACIQKLNDTLNAHENFLQLEPLHQGKNINLRTKQKNISLNLSKGVTSLRGHLWYEVYNILEKSLPRVKMVK